MSSLARRSLRTTAAAAGIAALGLGFAGQALAAPELPALPGADGLGDAGLPAAPALPSEEGFFMPGVANIEMPAISTAAPELPSGDAFAVPTAPDLAAPEAPAFAAPAAPAAPDMAAPDLAGAESLPSVPEAPATDGAVDTDFDVENGEDATAPHSDGGAQSAGSALAGLDMARSLMELAQGAAADGPSTQGNEIG
ncbi:hypothetical protein ACVGOW_00250 [Pseudonocardia saturnea]